MDEMKKNLAETWFSELRSGWEIIQIEFSIITGLLTPGPLTLSIENHHQRPSSA
jgi:hypothetical protein